MSRRGKEGRPPWRRGSDDDEAPRAWGWREEDGDVGGVVLKCGRASTALWCDHSPGTANGGVEHDERGAVLGHKNGVQGR